MHARCVRAMRVYRVNASGERGHRAAVALEHGHRRRARALRRPPDPRATVQRAARLHEGPRGRSVTPRAARSPPRIRIPRTKRSGARRESRDRPRPHSPAAAPAGPLPPSRARGRCRRARAAASCAAPPPPPAAGRRPRISARARRSRAGADLQERVRGFDRSGKLGFREREAARLAGAEVPDHHRRVHPAARQPLPPRQPRQRRHRPVVPAAPSPRSAGRRVGHLDLWVGIWQQSKGWGETRS